MAYHKNSRHYDSNNKQQTKNIHRLTTGSDLSYRRGRGRERGGASTYFTGQIFALDSVVVDKNVHYLGRVEVLYLFNTSLHNNTKINEITEETKKLVSLVALQCVAFYGHTHLLFYI